MLRGHRVIVRTPIFLNRLNEFACIAYHYAVWVYRRRQDLAPLLEMG